MEAAIIVAIISGLASLGGIALQVSEKISANRRTAKSSDRQADDAAAARVDANNQWFTEKLKEQIKETEDRASAAEARAVAAEERAGKAFAELTEVQGKLIGALARLETLEIQKARDQAMIEELQGQMGKLKAQ